MNFFIHYNLLCNVNLPSSQTPFFFLHIQDYFNLQPVIYFKKINILTIYAHGRFSTQRK